MGAVAASAALRSARVRLSSLPAAVSAAPFFLVFFSRASFFFWRSSSSNGVDLFTTLAAWEMSVLAARRGGNMVDYSQVDAASIGAGLFASGSLRLATKAT